MAHTSCSGLDGASDSRSNKGAVEEPVLPEPSPKRIKIGSSPWRSMLPSPVAVSGDTWGNSSGPIRDSWSQTLDSWFNEALEGQSSSGSSTSDSRATFSGSTSSATTTSGTTANEDSAFPNTSKEWEYLLSTTPSDPFNIFPSAPKPRTEEHAASALSTDNPPPSNSPPQIESSASSGASVVKLPDIRTFQFPISFRARAPALVSDPRNFVSPSELAPPLPEGNLGCDQPRPPPHYNAPDILSSPSPSTVVTRQTVFSAPTRGLTGWRPLDNSDSLVLDVIPRGTKFFNTATLSSLPPLQPPCPRPSGGRATAVKVEPSAAPTVTTRRTRRKNPPTVAAPTADPSHSDDMEDEDSEGYLPSSSPFGSRHNSPISKRPPSIGLSDDVMELGPRPRRGKGKAKGSAALALAVVTQISRLKQTVENGLSESVDGITDLDLDPDSVAIRPGRKRKNNPIPLPVPVPHLIKKSRGRKVPHARELSSDCGESLEEPLDDEPEASSTASRTRKAATPYSLGEGGKRTYMCEVAGCGKCFVRGEHLKRHVRSIHTYDKPHPCPYEGCDKSFSRRDNLASYLFQ
ncbi:zinc finger and SCAN domain-containing protein 5 [Coprinopsis cinerea AmutBmut pab1-1]|nr:zinc finger and SCAN domain-containing protein 5 [Coprinopsis cinerea AmutBmut pab1-1]